MNKIPNFILVGALLGGFFAAASVRADQVFLFSDDLSFLSNIDSGQTSAKLANGRFYTADDSVSSAVASDTVANPSKLIVSARLDVSVSIPSDAMIIYYLSNNGGLKWTQVNPGFTYTFDSAGNELRWRAVITRNSPFVQSASIDQINITYTVSDSITPSVSSNFTGGSFGSVAYGTDINSFLCRTLSSLGLSCGSGTPEAYQPATSGSGSVIGSVFSPGSTAPVNASDNSSNNSVGGSNLTAAIYTAGKKQEGSNSVNLVRVKGREEIYEIVGGKKHLLPTMDIFFNYGFKLEMVQDITQKQLDKFPRIKLMRVTGDKKNTFYFTEGGMIRLIPDKNVFNSYGDREEDIIVISKKEFNWYPQNQFVFLENPLNRDVYQLVNGKVKRYLTQSAVKRMKIDLEQIAPINQVELSTYQTDKPIIL
ncbi:MAG: hypothetical protein HYT67_00675 [Candidatus Yanofskybacteria bacterium]|nr:hypothetical protein [Candidatus Yanofskybacteria bacterium]